MELALIQRVLPEEVMLSIFQRLSPYVVGRCSLVCRQWRLLADHPRLWERACKEAFTTCHK